MPINILNRPLLEVDSFSEVDHDYLIYAHSAITPKSCPDCNSNRIVGFGRNEQLVKDLPMQGKRVSIYFDTRRFRCNDCNRTFLEKHPDFHSDRAMTVRLATWIGQQSIRRTFASLAEETGVVEGTIRNIFRDHVNELEKTVRFETPKWMGIDDIHLIKTRGVATNIEKTTVVGVIENRNQETVIKFFSGLKNKNQIQYVAMDMWMPYKTAINTILPSAVIVIDKFHVIKMANEALGKVRNAIRTELTLKEKRNLTHDRSVLLKRQIDLDEKEAAKIKEWFLSYPLLGEAYRLKEAFLGIYEAKSIPDAKAAYEQWQKSIPLELTAHFSDLTRAFQNWMPEILNYFKNPVPNAYTECLNSLIRVINRLGRGYSFEALRAKILFTEGVHSSKKDRAKFIRRQGKALPDKSLAMVRFQQVDLHEETDSGLNYGAEIATLVRFIEEGRI